MRLEEEVEAYLLAAGGWVPGRELVKEFDLPDKRRLRQVGKTPGLCTLCAISGNKGYKHYTLATTKEWEEYYARERQHNIRALMNLRRMRKLRKLVTRSVKRPPVTFEKDTGQALLLATTPGGSGS